MKIGIWTWDIQKEPRYADENFRRWACAGSYRDVVFTIWVRVLDEQPNEFLVASSFYAKDSEFHWFNTSSCSPPKYGLPLSDSSLEVLLEKYGDVAEQLIYSPMDLLTDQLLEQETN